MFVKITKLVGEDFQADYKGLELYQIKPGSQLYPAGTNEAYFIYNGEIVQHEDINIIEEAEYEVARKTVQEKQPMSEVELLKEENVELKSRLELVEAAVDDMIFGGGVF